MGVFISGSDCRAVTSSLSSSDWSRNVVRPLEIREAGETQLIGYVKRASLTLVLVEHDRFVD
jgi:hypothetical protein